jgi:hypothetical protein
MVAVRDVLCWLCDGGDAHVRYPRPRCCWWLGTNAAGQAVRTCGTRARVVVVAVWPRLDVEEAHVRYPYVQSGGCWADVSPMRAMRERCRPRTCCDGRMAVLPLQMHGCRLRNWCDHCCNAGNAQGMQVAHTVMIAELRAMTMDAGRTAGVVKATTWAMRSSGTSARVAVVAVQPHTHVRYALFRLHGAPEPPQRTKPPPPRLPSLPPQDAHHSMNTGNYGSSFAWGDTWLGTHIPHHKVVRAGKRKPVPGEEGPAPAPPPAAGPVASGADSDGPGARKRGRSPTARKVA